MAFASCSNEDVAQSTVETNPEKNSNLTLFVTGAAETRTSLNYDDGAFFWEAGDYIYVKDDNGTWNKSSNTQLRRSIALSLWFLVSILTKQLIRYIILVKKDLIIM